MPRVAKDYSNCCVYVLRPKGAPVEGDCYVGSTCDLKARVQAHRASAKNTKQKRCDNALYRRIRATEGGFDAWECVVLEAMNCCGGPEALQAAERKWFDLLQPSLNKHRPNAFLSSEKRAHLSALVRKWWDAHPGYYRQWNYAQTSSPTNLSPSATNNHVLDPGV